MSSSHPASEYFTIATSSSASDESSDSSCIGSTNVGTFIHVDKLNAAYTKCCDKIQKYEDRRVNLITRIKSLRKSQQATIIPPPVVPTFEEVKESACFERKLIDDRLYSEVLLVPSSSDEEIEVLNVPIIRSNIYLINNLQKQININDWRLKKQITKRQKLNKLMLNQIKFNQVYNSSSNLVYNDLSEPITSEYQPFRAQPTSRKQQKVRSDPSSYNHSIFGIYVSTAQAERDPILAFKLRLKIRQFRNVITSSYIKFLCYYKFKLLSYPIYPQMDAHGSEGTDSGDKKLNTVLQTQRDSSEGVSQPIIYPEWQQLVSSDHFSTYPTSTNRWTKFKTLVWTSSNVNQSTISIPSSLISELKNTPLFIPFRNNRYWKGDFEFKFVLNSNKFQQGSLQISFIYCSDLEQSFELFRNNIYSASQTNHCILNAGSSNEGILKIPFKYFNPVITTNPTENVDYCKIYIRVLNTLLCTSATYNSCDLSVFVNLDNAYFTGSIDFSLINNPQMFHLMRAIVKTAEFGLNQLDCDTNRDNPPDISVPSNVQLTNASSWSVGNGSLDVVNHLRLCSLGQTPHPNLNHDELKTNVINRIFGLVNILDWKFSHKAGDLLLNIEAAPMGKVKNYMSSIVTVSDRTYTLYGLPPVAVMSNLFAYWRGSLELRLDFVATSFHTGSILIAYIPGIVNDVTIDQARSSNYVVCSLQESQTYTIRVPFIANSPSWPRKYNKSYKIQDSIEINPPGSIQIFVLNPLIPLDNVHNLIQINCYMRAGNDFELLVPIQPNISTPYNLNYKDAKFNELKLLSANKTMTTFYYICSGPPNGAYYITLTHNLNSDQNPQAYESFRDGKQNNPDNARATSLFDDIPQLPGINPFYLESSLPVIFKIFQNSSSTAEFIQANYFVLYNELCSSVGRTILWPVKSQEAAIKYAKSEQSWSDLLNAIIPIDKTAGSNYYKVNITYLTKIFVHVHIYNDISSEFSFCEPNNEERTLSNNYLDMSQTLSNTSHGMSLYGERFNDLKDYCRRYQYYTNVMYKKPSSNLVKKQAIAIVPLVPQGLTNPVVYSNGDINHIVNRCKDGFIPIVSSGYRFYRGGLRMRIVSDTRRNVNLWVQHRPEMLLKYLQTHLIDPDNQSLSDYFNHSYSFTIQNLELNNVLSLEIPWYSKNMLGCSFLPKVLSSIVDINSQKLTSFSLGSLVLGIDADPQDLNVPINLEIYYSIADDFHFNTFQGFPLMLTLDQIPSTYTVYPQMGMFDKIMNSHPTIKKYDEIADKLNDKIDKVGDVLVQIPEMIDSFFSSTDPLFRISLAHLFSEICHVLVSPSIKTLCVSIMSILFKLGLVFADGVMAAYKLIKRLCKLIFDVTKKKTDSNSTEVPSSATISAEPILPQSGDDSSDVVAGFVSMVWAGLSSLMNVSFKTCDNISDYASVLMDGITKGAMQANTIFRFIKNCFAVIEKCYQGIVNKIYVKYSKYQRLKVEEETLQEWLDLCDCLLNPCNATLVQNDLAWREAVYCAARYGHIYLCKQQPGIAPRVDVYIRKIYDKLINLRDSLQAEKLFPSLRMEAYGLWIDGAPGIGKSSMITRLSTDLLNSVNYKGSSNLIFNVTPLDKYWNNCNHQPVISIDDAFAITTPECIQNQLWTYFTVMSPVPLIPPMAELKDKKMHYNPELMITCSNEAFPRLTGLAEATALYRRRHQLIKAQLKNLKLINYPFGCTDEQLKNFEHLEFSLAKDPRDSSTVYGKTMSYAELITFLKTDFQEFKVRSAIAYEERKRLQFSMMTDTQARRLPQTTKISEYLKAIDTDNLKKNLAIRTEHDTLENTFKLIDQIQKNPHFSLKCIVNIPSLDSVEAPSIEEVSEQVKIGSQALPDPEMGEVDEAEFLKACEEAGDPIPEEELREMQKGNEEFQALMKERQEAILAKPVPGLVALNESLDQDMSTREDFGLRYRLRFSSAGTLFKMYSNQCTNKLETNPLIRGMLVYNQLHPEDQFNNIYSYDSRECVHKLITNCYSVSLEARQGLNFPVWHVPVNLDFVTCTLSYDPLGTSYIRIVDTPCCAQDCVVKNTREWSDLVSKWLVYGLKYAPWILTKTYSPIVSLVAKDLSKLRRYINRIQHWIGKTIKFCLYDVLYRTVHTLGSLFCKFGGFMSGLACMLGLVTAVKSFKSNTPQLISSGDNTTKNTNNNVRKIIFSSFSPQSTEENSQCKNVIAKRIVNNTVYIRYENEKTGKCSNMKCLVLKERYLLVLRHYIEYLDTNVNDDSVVSLVWADSGYHRFKYTDFNIIWCADSNIGVLRLPNWFSARRSLLPFISNEESFCGSIVRDCTILDHCIHETYIYDQNITLANNITIAPTSYSKALLMPNAYCYRKNYPGMCGSVLLNNKPIRPIIGIHVAGAMGKGFSEPICASMFDKFFEHVEGKLKEDIIPIDWRTLDCKQIPVEDRKLYLNGTHRYLGTVDSNIAKYEMGISSIIPSTIQGVFPVGTEPGPLTPKDPRINGAFSPLLSGCEKHCNPTYDFNPSHLALAEKDLSNLILSNCKPIRLTVRPLSELQAINGIDDLEEYRSLVWNTSEGFYLSRLRPTGARDKRWLFNFNNNGIVESIHPNLREILDNKHNDRLNNIVPLTIHDDCLKDSRLPLHKIKVPGKVRVFSISPVDFTIQFRQYFLDFIASYTRARFSCEHAIGINVHGPEWSELATKFKGLPIITGDYSGFGPTLNSEVVSSAFKIINRWYNAYGGSVEDNNIRIIMSKELINAKHLMGDYLYEVNCGLPSGNPATVIFNSLVNSLYLRCAWLDIMQATAFRSLVDQRNLMKIVTYGDDLIASIDPTVVKYFNNNSLSQFFKKHNIIFTDAAKTGINVEPCTSLDKATFLKHSFKNHPTRPGMYLAALDELSITECANWIRKSPDPKTATYDNCIQGTMLAYGHGPLYYNRYVEVISKAWFELYNEEFLVRTWEDLDVLFLDQGFYFDW